MMKPITSLAIMQLVEEGKILLSDPVAAFLPGFGDMQVYVSGDADNMVTRPAKGPITILQLLTHTAGYTYDYEFRFGAVTGWYDNHLDFEGDLDSIVTVMSRGPLTHDPGTAWFSGSGPSTSL